MIIVIPLLLLHYYLIHMMKKAITTAIVIMIIGWFACASFKHIRMIGIKVKALRCLLYPTLLHKHKVMEFQLEIYSTLYLRDYKGGDNCMVRNWEKLTRLLGNT